MFIKKVVGITFFFFGFIGARSPVVATLMIKNEAPSICETLQPLVDGGIDTFFIFDTGSTDKTIEVVRAFFDEHKECIFCIKQEPFVDFSTSRNRALELTEKYFPSAIFTLIVDAEWLLHGVKPLIAYCIEHICDRDAAYATCVHTYAYEFYVPLLIRNSSKLRYKGVVHEYLDVKEAVQVPSDIFFEFRRSDRGQTSTEKRWLRDKELLLGQLKKNPNDSHTLFYLGQTCCCLNDFSAGHEFFVQCVPAALEEYTVGRAYQAAYWAASAIEELIRQKKENSWDRALKWYSKAHEICPDRAEPLCCMAAHYYKIGDMLRCFEYASFAARLPYPCVSGYVEKSVYDRGRYELLYAAALSLDKEIEARWALDKLRDSTAVL